MAEIGPEVLAKLPQIGPSAFALYCYLADRASINLGKCSPSYDMMIEETGLASGTISVGLKVLAAAGLITIKRRFNKSSVIDVALKNEATSNYTTTSLINIDDDVKQHVALKNEAAQDTYDADTPFNKLSDAFANSAHILPYNPQRWTPAINFMLAQEVEPDDVINAVNELAGKNYQIAGPWSIQNAALQSKSKRKINGNGKPKRKEYITDL